MVSFSEACFGVVCDGSGAHAARVLRAASRRERFHDWRMRVCEKKLMVEVASPAEAHAVARAGVDGVQFDKVKPDELRAWVKTLRKEFPRLTLVAAGGVNETNAGACAATGVDALATSSIYFGNPADIRAESQAS